MIGIRNCIRRSDRYGDIDGMRRYLKRDDKGEADGEGEDVGESDGIGMVRDEY